MIKKKKEVIYTDVKSPDDYKCIKTPLVNIIKDKKNIKDIFDCVYRANKISIKTYQLLKLWILYKYKNGGDVPKITSNIIKIIQKSILISSRGPKLSNDNNTLLLDMQKLYPFKKENGKNLSSILSYSSVFIVTAIENNVKANFIKYVKRYVNSYFKHKYADKIKNNKFKTQLFKELAVLKNDIINNTNKCDEKYKFWLNKNRYNIVPESYKKSYYYDIICYPQKYLKYMIWMNVQLESLNAKLFRCIPLHTDIIPKSYPIDTKTLIELFVDDKNTYLKDISGTKDEIWHKYFKIGIKLNNYKFDYTLITDGYSVSIRFIHNDKLIKENQKKEKMKVSRQKYKGFSREDKKAYRKKDAEIAKRNKKANKRKRKQKKTTNKKYVDFLYIDEIDKNILVQRKNVYVDPGKRSLFFMIDDNDKKLDYTNKRRLCETKRLKYQRLINNYKNQSNITEIESKLSNYNSSTCNINKFKKYIKVKNEVNELLFEKYNLPKFRKYRWYAYINRKRSEDNMLNLIEKTYGKNINLIIGDASLGKSMRHFISTPNVSLKRKLKERFNVYHIDEFRTSCLHYKTEERCKNLIYEDKKKRKVLMKQLGVLIKQLIELIKKRKTLNKNDNQSLHRQSAPLKEGALACKDSYEKITKKIDYVIKYLQDDKNKLRKLHSVLTYKMEDNRLGCINRDLNACLNMRKIFKYYLQTGDRPLKYKRSYKLINATNLDHNNEICQIVASSEN